MTPLTSLPWLDSLAMDICGEEYSQMFSLVDGVREHALAANRMTELAKTLVPHSDRSQAT